MVKKGWIPPRSPLSLLQEDIFPNEWLLLISCIMLNCTTRKQVEGVLLEFVNRWPTPHSLLAADKGEVLDLIKSLGFGRRRVVNIFKMTQAYVDGSAMDIRSLPGIGEYAARAHEIFCQGIIGDAPPNDHALVGYWRWIKNNESNV